MLSRPSAAAPALIFGLIASIQELSEFVFVAV
jgi:hypothetical protein